MNWQKLYTDNRYSSFEDPVTSFNTPKELFYDMYKDFLDTMDGLYPDSCIEFYYEACTVNQDSLRFVDEDARYDFISACQEMNLIPELQEIYEGEDKVDKEKRLKAEAGKEKQSIINKSRKADAKIRGEENKRKQLLDSLGKLRDKLLINEVDTEKYQQIQEKINRIVTMLDEYVN